MVDPLTLRHDERYGLDHHPAHGGIRARGRRGEGDVLGAPFKVCRQLSCTVCPLPAAGEDHQPLMLPHARQRCDRLLKGDLQK